MHTCFYLRSFMIPNTHIYICLYHPCRLNPVIPQNRFAGTSLPRCLVRSASFVVPGRSSNGSLTKLRSGHSVHPEIGPNSFELLGDRAWRPAKRACDPGGLETRVSI